MNNDGTSRLRLVKLSELSDEDLDKIHDLLVRK